MGGNEAKSPMPWMVGRGLAHAWSVQGLMVLGPSQSMCGSTLLNSRFLITAAPCPCNEGMCTRGMSELGKEPVQIKVM